MVRLKLGGFTMAKIRLIVQDEEFNLLKLK